MSRKSITSRTALAKLTLEEQLVLATAGTKDERKALACFSKFAEVNDLLRKDAEKSVRITARVNDPRLSSLGDSSSAAAAIISATMF